MDAVDRNSLLSKTISSLRFPMSVMVVLIHANVIIQSLPSSDLPYYQKDHIVFRCIYDLFSNVISRVAVPTFFIISGFLFFYGFQLSFCSYWGKLKSRFKSLVVPYLTWNFLMILLYFGLLFFTGGTLFGDNTLISKYHCKDFLDLFWSSKDFWGYPIDWPLWFIRDLIVMVLFSPVFYIVAKYLKYLPMILLFILWLCDVKIKFLSLDTLTILFFYVGAYLGLEKLDFVEKLKNGNTILFILYLLSILTVFVFKMNQVALKISIVIGVSLFMSFFAKLIESKTIRIDSKVNEFLDSSTFFIFAFHAFPLVAVAKLFLAILKPNTSFAYVVIYFLSVVIVVLFTLIIYYFVRHTAFVRRALMGNR
jgi:fucose 4-O-acetylase-like acetyltransferase